LLLIELSCCGVAGSTEPALSLELNGIGTRATFIAASTLIDDPNIKSAECLRSVNVLLGLPPANSTNPSHSAVGD